MAHWSGPRCDASRAAVSTATLVLAGGLVLALGGLWFAWQRGQAVQARAAELTEAAAQAETLRQEVARLKKEVLPPAELERLQKSNEELQRLRGEVRQLREDRAQLQKLQQEVQLLRAAAGQVQQMQAETAALRNQNQQLQGVLTAQGAAQALNACINNLRQLDGAKEQWALENRKTVGALPTEADLIGEKAFIRQKPVCPQGGVYTLGPIGAKPTCSIPGHQLP